MNEFVKGQMLDNEMKKGEMREDKVVSFMIVSYDSLPNLSCSLPRTLLGFSMFRELKNVCRTTIKFKFALKMTTQVQLK